MKFIDLAKKRYSVRSYQQTQVEKEKLDIILKAGSVSPTAGNCQPNNFLVVNSAEALSKLSTATNAHGAPLAIVVCASKKKAWVRAFDNSSMLEIDATIATDHMMMCAEDLRLSSCWLTYFNPTIVCKVFNIPSDLVPVNILVIGYSADKSPLSADRHTNGARNSISEITKYNSF